MKYSLHVPVEQFGFVAADIETEDVKDVESHYTSIVRAFRARGGISEKQFNELIDEYLSTKTIQNGQEIYEKLSPAQRDILQAIKRSYQRSKR